MSGEAHAGIVAALDARGAWPGEPGRGNARCPAHDDRNPSLSIAKGDGCALVNCRAGCSWEDVLAALDPPKAALYDDHWTRPNGSERTIEAVYVYTDEAGTPLYRVERYRPKDFLPFLPDATKSGIGKTRRVLYRLPEVIAGIEAGRIVHLVAGEKDSDALAAVGEVATCHAFGEKAWRQDYAAVFAGAYVVVVADRDDEGRRWARKVKVALEPVAAMVVVVEAKAGKDASDHLAAGHTVSEFVPWTEDGEPAEPERVKQGAASSRIVDMAQAIKDAAGPLPYRVRPLALDGSVTLLVGRRGEHKSWLSLFACSAVQAGGELEPFGIHRGPALYLDAENGRRRMGGRFTLAALAPDALTVADGRGLRLPGAMAKVRELVELTGARLLVLDSLRRLSPGARENDSDDAAPIMAALADLAQDLEVAVIVIHHRSSKPGAPDSRGSSALEDQADVVWVVEKVAGDPDRRSRRRLRNTKMRDDAEHPSLWVDFKKVAGFMTIAVAEPFKREDDAGDGEEPAAHEDLADRIRALADQADMNGGWPPKRVAAAVGSNPDSGTFKRALGELLASGEWVGEGATSARRVRPANSGHSGHSLGGGLTGLSGNEHLFDPEGGSE